MKVKIKSGCEYPRYWYYDKIGKEYDVEESSNKDHFKIINSGFTNGWMINKQDCEIMEPTIEEQLKEAFENDYTFTAEIEGTKTSGKVQYEDGRYYLCQNDNDGAYCRNKKGFKYSWFVNGCGEINNLKFIKVEKLEEWKENDVIESDGIAFMIVAVKNDRKMILEDTVNKLHLSQMTIEEHKKQGWKKVQPIPTVSQKELEESYKKINNLKEIKVI